MTEHTGGPWRWHWRFEDGVANGSVYAEPRKGHAYAVAICPRYQIRPQWEADARLITAAPDMLAALKAVNKLISEAAMTGFNCMDGDWAERLFHSQQATSAAIKSATLTSSSTLPDRNPEVAS